VPARPNARHERTRHKCAIASGVIGLALLATIGSASAQFSGSVAVVSDYRYRGVSLSDERPAAQLGLVYDGAEGWYAGTFVSTVDLGFYHSRGVQAIGFAGYASRLPSGLSLEAGADYAIVTATPRYEYSEVYAGFAYRNVSGRLYFSPHYFGQDAAAVYAELDFSQPLVDNLRLFAHLGVLSSTANGYYGSSSGPLLDGAIGLGIDWQGFRLQLSIVGVDHSTGAYATNGFGRRSGAVASLSYAF
jgi:uncharacterized protein (TIGR02001 family)